MVAAKLKKNGQPLSPETFMERQRQCCHLCAKEYKFKKNAKFLRNLAWFSAHFPLKTVFFKDRNYGGGILLKKKQIHATVKISR
jgi:hypothetical protein